MMYIVTELLMTSSSVTYLTPRKLLYYTPIRGGGKAMVVGSQGWWLVESLVRKVGDLGGEGVDLKLCLD